MAKKTTRKVNISRLNHTLFLILAALLLAMSACSDDTDSQGATLGDAGAVADAGGDVAPDNGGNAGDVGERDASAPVDAAAPDANMPADAGTPDANAPVDAIAPDAREPADVGTPDANAPDTSSPDASIPEDVGSPDTAPTCDDPDGDGYGVGDGCLGADCAEGDRSIFPGQTEACNGYDDNCDGVIDEGCDCVHGDTQQCGTNVGVCTFGSQTCQSGTWSSCSGGTTSSPEACGDNLDNDCDGQVDEGCTPNCADNDGVCPSGCARANDNDCAIDCRDPQGWPASWATFEDQVLLLANQERAAGATCGSTPYPATAALAFDAELREAARCHSMDMAINNYFSHTGLDGSSFSSRATTAGYTGFPSGENIAAGQATPAQVMSSWMNSPGHCRNIMNSNNEELGVGYYYHAASQYRHYWTQVFGIAP